MKSQKVVTPVETGVKEIYNCWKELDSVFRRNDGKQPFLTSALEFGFYMPRMLPGR